jgi:hypothetical protein
MTRAAAKSASDYFFEVREVAVSVKLVHKKRHTLVRRYDAPRLPLFSDSDNIPRCNQRVNPCHVAELRDQFASLREENKSIPAPEKRRDAVWVGCTAWRSLGRVWHHSPAIT